MKKSALRYRFLLWYAKRILRVPIIVNFTPDEMEQLFGVGFAWSPEASRRMQGNDNLIARMQRAETLAGISTGSRKARRLVNQAAKRAAKKGAQKWILAS